MTDTKTLHGATKAEQDEATIRLLNDQVERAEAKVAMLRSVLADAARSLRTGAMQIGESYATPGLIAAAGWAEDVLTANPNPAADRLRLEATLGRAYFEASDRPEIHTNGDVAKAVSQAYVALMDFELAQAVTHG